MKLSEVKNKKNYELISWLVGFGMQDRLTIATQKLFFKIVKELVSREIMTEEESKIFVECQRGILRWDILPPEWLYIKGI